MDHDGPTELIRMRAWDRMPGAGHMAESDLPPASAVEPVDLGHPRGTLAIVTVFGLLFALGWLATYFLIFLGRGAPHH